MNHLVNENPIVNELRIHGVAADANANVAAKSTESRSAMNTAAPGGNDGDAQLACRKPAVVVRDDVRGALDPCQHRLRSGAELRVRQVDADLDAISLEDARPGRLRAAGGGCR